MYAYGGTLTDIGLGVLTAQHPAMTVRPEESAFGPDGLVAGVRVPVALNPSTGAFTMTLIASAELTNARTGAHGVPYVIEVGRFELAEDLTSIWHGTEVWRFTAAAGGGNVGGMSGGSLLAVWVGPPWPPAPLPPGLYIDTTPPNAWGVVS